MTPQILVYTSTEVMLDLYEALLTELGYTVIPYYLPYRAIGDAGAVIRVGPDVILFDIAFPTMDRDLAFLAQLETHPATTHIPIVCLTIGGLPPVHAARLARLGFPTVEIPWTLESLRTAIEAQLIHAR